MEVPLFYFLSGITVLSALGVVLTPKPSRALLCLIVTMTVLSCLYLTLDAPFVSMINLIVYAGAILILFLFVIMLQGIGATDVPLLKRFKHGFLLLAFLLPLMFGIGLTLLSSQTDSISDHAAFSGDAKAVGTVLFTQYLLPFELVSLLLLLAIFAAVSLAKKDDQE